MIDPLAEQDSLKIKRDNYSAMKTAKDEGFESGKAEERAKAEEEKRDTAIKLAVKLKDKNMLVDEIAELTGLSVEEIEVLV